MNNGNILSSLLGATGAGSSAAKSTAPKNRADTTEKFQQAFEQVRPEVAARKPVARKAPDRQDTGARAETAKHNAPHQSDRADNEKSLKSAEQREPRVKEVARESRPAHAEKSYDSKSAGKTTKLAGAEHKSAVESLDDPAKIGDPAGALDLNELSPEAAGLVIQFPITTAPVDGELGTLTEELLGDLDEALPDLSLEVGAEGEEGNREGADLLAALVTPVPLADSETQAVNLASAGVDVKTTATNSLNPAAQTTLTTNGQLLPSNGTLVMDEVLPASSNSESALANKAGETADLADNPDFALLGNKAAFNKMMEASLTSQEKAAPAIDLAKPAPTPTSVVEGLARSMEAQSPSARAFVVQTGVPVTVGSPQWSQAVGEKVLWLAAQNVSAAEIRLDPPELGPMQVKVSVNQDQATVTFTSHNPVVRDALDQQLNRLREMFAEQGLNLVNVDVSDKSFAQQERDQEESGQGRANAGVEEDELAPVAETSIASLCLVDHYA